MSVLCAWTLPALDIVPASGNLPGIRQSALELQKYLRQLTGEEPRIVNDSATAKSPVFRMELDKKLHAEEWKVVSTPDGLLFSGGSTRALFYAVYHYLEDSCGVIFFNPREEEVPKFGKLPLKDIALHGEPAFPSREIFSMYARDKGAFATKMRLNGDGDSLERLSQEYGGFNLFGPPVFCHTFGAYMPPEKYGREHPEYFAMRNGKRVPGKKQGGEYTSQPCLSNPEVRRIFLEQLRKYIADGKAAAEKSGIPAPRIYDISQNDNSDHCQCPECKALIARYGGSESGVMIDFVNSIAREIAKEHPDILISTFAYQKTEEPPKNLKAEKNVLVGLCDTRGNHALPRTDPGNKIFRELILEWSKVADHISVWDYCVAYREHNEMPYPSELCYQEDMKFFRKNHIQRVFSELEYPVFSDVRDFKLWLRAKLMENPDQNLDKLMNDFADNFYGKAGPLFIQYRKMLYDSVKRHNSCIDMYPTADSYTHLDLDTLVRAQMMFDEGEKLLADDEVRLKRWRHARLSLDRACIIRTKALMREYLARNGSLKGYPFDRKQLAERIRKTWTERLDLRPLSEKREASLKTIEDEIAKFSVEYTPESLAIPEEFKKFPAKDVFDFTMENSSRYRNHVELVKDPDSHAGAAARLQFPHPDKNTTLEKYKLPMVFGVYSVLKGGTIFKKYITDKMVKDNRYHYYNLGSTKLAADAYLFCFWSWFIQQKLMSAFDPNDPDALFDVYIQMKLTGPAFVKGDTGKNAIWIDRIVLVRKTPNAR